MHHRPTTLALLISLIGVGAAQAAQVDGETLPPPSALEVTRWAPGLLWRGPPAGVGVLTTPIDPPPAAIALPAAQAAAEPAVAAEPGTADVHPDPPGARATAQAVVPADVPAAEPRPATPARLQRLRGLVASLVPQRLTAAAARPAGARADPHDEGAAPAVRRLSPALASAAPAARAAAPGLEQTLATLLPQEIERLPRQPIASRVAARFPAAADAPSTLEAAAPQASSARAALPDGRRDVVVVAAPADRVLHDLQALLGAPREADRPAAAIPDVIVVATQAEKVLATLAELANSRRARERGVEPGGRIARPAAAKTRHAAVSRLSAQALVAAAAPTRGADLVPQGALAARDDVERPLPALAEPVAVAAPVAVELAAIAAPARANPFGAPAESKLALDESTLDRVRGGFVTENLNIAFGIERAVYVNGALVATTSLNVSELGRLSAGRGTAALDTATLGLIQSGSGNVVAAGAISSQSLGTVIQNTLDGQKIQNVTVINATVNSLGILRGLDLQSSLRGAVIDSLRR